MAQGCAVNGPKDGNPVNKSFLVYEGMLVHWILAFASMTAGAASMSGRKKINLSPAGTFPLEPVRGFRPPDSRLVDVTSIVSKVDAADGIMLIGNIAGKHADLIVPGVVAIADP